MIEINKLFSAVYAKYYDALYQDKEYDAECDVLEQIFRSHKNTVKSILDVGCGTGGHLIPLTERGYHVTGIDSSVDMINILRQKTSPKIHSRIYQGRIQELDISHTFDAIICMFAVLNYITDTAELLQALKKIHKHLKPDGLFIFDIWYGPAVTWIKPDPQVKMVSHGDIMVQRMAAPTLDTFNQNVRVHYTLLTSKDGQDIEDVSETHIMRYFFPQEIIYFLQLTGFEILKLSEFMDLDKPPSIETWNVMIVARRK